MLMILSIPGVLFVHPSSSSPPAASPPFVLRPSPSVLGCCLLCQFLSNFTHPPLSPPSPRPPLPSGLVALCLPLPELGLLFAYSNAPLLVGVRSPPPSPSLPPSPLLPPSLPPSLPPFLPSSLPPFLPSSLPPSLPPPPPPHLSACILFVFTRSLFPRFYRPSFCDRAVAMDPELRVTAQRAMRLGISLAERSLDYLLPATSPESPPRPRPTRPALPMSESGPPNSVGFRRPVFAVPQPLGPAAVPVLEPVLPTSPRPGAQGLHLACLQKAKHPRSMAQPGGPLFLLQLRRMPCNLGWRAPLWSQPLLPGFHSDRHQGCVLALLPGLATLCALIVGLAILCAPAPTPSLQGLCVSSGRRPLRVSATAKSGSLLVLVLLLVVALMPVNLHGTVHVCGRRSVLPSRWLRLWCCQLAFSSKDSPLVLRLPCCIPCIPSLPASLLPLRHSSLAWFLLQL